MTQKLPARSVLALWLLIAPTAIIIFTIGLYAAANFMLGNGSGISVIINIFLFLTGIVGVVTWLPGLVVGIVLLATKK